MVSISFRSIHRIHDQDESQHRSPELAGMMTSQVKVAVNFAVNFISSQLISTHQPAVFGEVSTASVRVFPRGSKNQGTDEVQDVNFDRFSMAPEMLLFRPPLATLATRWFAFGGVVFRICRGEWFLLSLRYTILDQKNIRTIHS